MTVSKSGKTPLQYFFLFARVHCVLQRNKEWFGLLFGQGALLLVTMNLVALESLVIVVQASKMAAYMICVETDKI